MSASQSNNGADSGCSGDSIIYLHYQSPMDIGKSTLYMHAHIRLKGNMDLLQIVLISIELPGITSRSNLFLLLF